MAALTETDRCAFGRDGFALLRGMLTPADVDAIRRATHGLRATRTVGVCERPHNTLVPLRWDDNAVATVLGNEQLMHRLATATAARDLRWISGYLSIKDPGSDALWWHQDWWCWAHPISSNIDAPQVALLCYLDATDVHGGALRLLPGSHLRTFELHTHLPHDGVTVSGDHPVMRDQTGQLTFEARPGDAAVVDYRLLHGTHPNPRTRGRACLIMNFTPSWSSLPDEIRAHLIRGLALPGPDERAGVPPIIARWLPAYNGIPVDLPLSRERPTPHRVV